MCILKSQNKIEQKQKYISSLNTSYLAKNCKDIQLHSSGGVSECSELADKISIEEKELEFLISNRDSVKNKFFLAVVPTVIVSVVTFFLGNFLK